MDTIDDNFIFFGRNSHTVLERIWDRKLARERLTQNPSAPIKLGLIIEGGGMRSIIAGGITLAMHKFKLNDAFDIIYATSAGAIVGAYFLSKQTPYGIALFYEHLNTEKFINLYHIPPFFNIDYLIEVIQHKKKLDVNAVKTHPSTLSIGATNITTGQQHFFTNRDNIDLFTAIKASCALPVFYGKPVSINGIQYLDGGIINSFPIEQALKDGCTDILILFTRPKIRRNYYQMMPFWFKMWQLKRYGKNFISSFYSREKFYEKALALIDGRENFSAPANIAVIAPKSQTVTISTINADRLKRAYKRSYRYGLKIFAQSKPAS